MKTLSDFKRRLAPGIKLHTYNHLFQNDMGIREIARVQSNAFTMTTPKGESWCYFPRAGNFKIKDINTAEIYEDGQLLLTYTFKD